MYSKPLNAAQYSAAFPHDLCRSCNTSLCVNKHVSFISASSTGTVSALYDYPCHCNVAHFSVPCGGYKEQFVFSYLVPHHWRRPLWPADSHRALFDGCQSGGCWEERLLLEEQCAAPLALHHSWPTGPRGQKVLWQILRWCHRPHQWVSDFTQRKPGFLWSNTIRPTERCPL